MGSGVTDCACCGEHIMVNDLEDGPHLCDECEAADCKGGEHMCEREDQVDDCDCIIGQCESCIPSHHADP